jgi:hypothetical protein
VPTLLSVFSAFLALHPAALASGQTTGQTGAALTSAVSHSTNASALIDPSIRPDALWDGRDSLDFRAANNPAMVPAAKAGFLIGDEYVLGTTVNGESRAYPIRFVWWHHVVNDSAGKPSAGGKSYFTVTYCIVCNTGMMFDSTVNGQPLRFDFYGLYNGVMTMYDKQTQSVWVQVQGKAVKGALTGAILKQGALLSTTWKRWKQLHPDTLVMAPDPAYKKYYDPKGTIVERGFDRFPDPHFKSSLTRRDLRLPIHEMVMAVSVPQVSPNVNSHSSDVESGSQSALYRAYPLKEFKGASGVINDSVGVPSVAVMYEAASDTCSAVYREIDGKSLTMEFREYPADKRGFYDKETGTRWSLEGLGLEGALAGKRLPRVNGTISEWYGWAAYFPQTSVFGTNKPVASITKTN